MSKSRVAEAPKTEAPKPHQIITPPEPKQKGKGLTMAMPVVEKIGRETWDAVTEKAEAKEAAWVKIFREHPAAQEYDWSETADTTVYQYITNSRSKLGWTRAKGTGGGSRATTSGDLPTTDDLKKAQTFAKDNGFKISELLKVVTSITEEFGGDTDKLQASLEFLSQFTD